MFCSKRGSVILGELVIPFLQYSPFTPVKPQPITPLRLPHIPPHIYLTPPHSKSPNPILLTPYSPLPILHSLLSTLPSKLSTLHSTVHTLQQPSTHKDVKMGHPIVVKEFALGLLTLGMYCVADKIVE